eukprot:402124-Lingulodinium_polyedra.AAC.1
MHGQQLHWSQVFELADHMAAKGGLSEGTAGGADGSVFEMWKASPSTTDLVVYQLFAARLLEGAGTVCDAWRTLILCGIPKAKLIEAFGDMRWICKTPCMQKWYLAPLTRVMNRYLTPCPVHALGFKKGMRVDYVIEIIRMCLYLSQLWSFCHCVIVQLDVETAFDTIIHACIAEALYARGCPAIIISAIMRELFNLQAYLQVNGVGDGNVFPFSRGGRQGGVETP